MDEHRGWKQVQALTWSLLETVTKLAPESLVLQLENKGAHVGILLTLSMYFHLVGVT